jgi:hypothetical protein
MKLAHEAVEHTRAATSRMRVAAARYAPLQPGSGVRGRRARPGRGARWWSMRARGRDRVERLPRILGVRTRSRARPVDGQRDRIEIGVRFGGAAGGGALVEVVLARMGRHATVVTGDVGVTVRQTVPVVVRVIVAVALRGGALDLARCLPVLPAVLTRRQVQRGQQWLEQETQADQ